MCAVGLLSFISSCGYKFDGTSSHNDNNLFDGSNREYGSDDNNESTCLTGYHESIFSYLSAIWG